MDFLGFKSGPKEMLFCQLCCLSLSSLQLLFAANINCFSTEILAFVQEHIIGKLRNSTVFTDQMNLCEFITSVNCPQER